jgi:hypothetical protein
VGKTGLLKEKEPKKVIVSKPNPCAEEREVPSSEPSRKAPCVNKGEKNISMSKALKNMLPPILMAQSPAL